MVELRETAGGPSSALPATRISRQAALLLRNGDIVGTDGISDLIFSVPITQNLYAIVWHRNHLGIMSANSLSLNGGVYNYDFTTSADQAYLNGQKSLGGGKYGMHSGDTNGNGEVHQDDIDNIWSVDVGKKGYYNGDMDLNNQVNNQDKNDFWFPNLGLNSQVPQ